MDWLGRSMGMGTMLAVGLCLVPAARAAPGSPTTRLRAVATSAHIDLDRARGVARFVRAPLGISGFAAGSDPGAAARAFFAAHGELFGVGDPTVELRMQSVSTDALGHTRVELSQYHHGLRVFGATVRAHFDASRTLIAAQGSTVPSVVLPLVPTLDAAEADVTATGAFGGPARAVGSELLVFDPGLVQQRPSDPRLAYAVAVRGPDVDATVFVDAHGGAVLLVASNIHDVLQRATYEYGYGPGFAVWQESDGPYTGGNPPMIDLIDFTEQTYSFFVNLSDGTYPSYDGESAVMEGVLNAPINCPNAQWNGVSVNFCDGLVTDDVVAHEWAHGYTERTQNLIYAYQAGALNESFSDIFGESVDLLNGTGLDNPGQVRDVGVCSDGGGSVRWLIGEETQGFGGAIRDMWDPTCMAHPGRVGDFEYFCNGGDDFFDNGGVHINSGVPNHTFALLVDGGNDNGASIAAIGMTKALAIYWRAMTVYQGEVSGFADHAAALLASCADLVNAGVALPDPSTGAASGAVMNEGDCDAVAAAVIATELQDDNPCGSGTLLDTSAAPAPCADDSDGETIFEEDFEGGLGAWSTSNAGVTAQYIARDWEASTELPDARAGSAAYAVGDQWFGDCYQDDQSGVMHLDSPEIALPRQDARRVLTFRHWIASEPRLDGGNLEISVAGAPFVDVSGAAFVFNPYNAALDASNNPLAGEAAFTGSDVAIPTGSWVQSVVDLSALTDPGDTVVLRFDFGVNECNGLFGWYVDDVRLLQCDATGGTDDGTDSGAVDTGDATTDGVDSTGSGAPPAQDENGNDLDGGTQGSGDSSGGASAGASDDGGCGCTSGPGPAGSLAWLVLFGAARRRRRRALQRD